MTDCRTGEDRTDVLLRKKCSIALQNFIAIRTYLQRLFQKFSGDEYPPPSPVPARVSKATLLLYFGSNNSKRTVHRDKKMLPKVCSDGGGFLNRS